MRPRKERISQQVDTIGSFRLRCGRWRRIDWLMVMLSIGWLVECEHSHSYWQSIDILINTLTCLFHCRPHKISKREYTAGSGDDGEERLVKFGFGARLLSGGDENFDDLLSFNLSTLQIVWSRNSVFCGGGDTCQSCCLVVMQLNEKKKKRPNWMVPINLAYRIQVNNGMVRRWLDGATKKGPEHWQWFTVCIPQRSRTRGSWRVMRERESRRQAYGHKTLTRTCHQA